MQPTPSERFWDNIADALTERRRSLLRWREIADINIMLEAIADGRVRIVAKRE